MDKVQLEYEAPKKTTLKYMDKEIEITTWLTFETQIFLIMNYLENYFNEANDIVLEGMEYHYIEAECKLMNYLYQINTNIDVESSLNDIYGDSGLFALVTYKITNWHQFRTRLDEVVKQAREQREREISLGKVLSGVMEQLQGFIDEISKLSPEDVEKMQKAGENLMDRLEKSSILRNPNDLAEIQEPVIKSVKKAKKEGEDEG